MLYIPRWNLKLGKNKILKTHSYQEYLGYSCSNFWTEGGKGIYTAYSFPGSMTATCQLVTTAPSLQTCSSLKFSITLVKKTHQKKPGSSLNFSYALRMVTMNFSSSRWKSRNFPSSLQYFKCKSLHRKGEVNFPWKRCIKHYFSALIFPFF